MFTEILLVEIRQLADRAARTAPKMSCGNDA